MGREILLIEDDESLNRAISFKLYKEGYVIYSAKDLESASKLWNERSVPLIICDINLPDGSGLDFCMEIRKESDVVFLFMTALDTEEDIMRGYEAGADDYVTKPFFLSVLVSKVNAIMQRYMCKVSSGAETGLSGAAGVCADTFKSGSITLFYDEGRIKKGDEYISLTAKELKLLYFFMKNPMRILTREQLLEAIWDIEGNFVDENTLAVNIRRLREKVEDNPSAPKLLKNIRGLGYIWDMECSRG